MDWWWSEIETFKGRRREGQNGFEQIQLSLCQPSPSHDNDDDDNGDDDDDDVDNEQVGFALLSNDSSDIPWSEKHRGRSINWPTA